jgi:hypothetical protein
MKVYQIRDEFIPDLQHIPSLRSEKKKLWSEPTCNSTDLRKDISELEVDPAYGKQGAVDKAGITG